MAERTMYRGDTFVLDAQVKKDGVPVNITGWKVWFTAKRTYVEPDNVAVMRHDSDALGGVTITDAVNGKVRVVTSPNATAGFPDGPVKLVYDLQTKDLANNIFTVETGTLTVLPDVTRATT